MKPTGSNRSLPVLSVLLILISSILLAIWSIKNTIALRNSLLALGAIAGLLFFINYPKDSRKTPHLGRLSQFTPLILSGCMFIWVLIHYIGFSQEFALQSQELTSTWLRVLLATIIGAATGLILRDHPIRSQFLWAGLLSSFIYLLIHYLGAYSQSGLAFMPNYYFSSPFGNKINTVLMGNLFISAICGCSADAFNQKQIKLTWGLSLFWLLGALTILFSFTTIIDTRNGIGIALILIGSWILYVGSFILKRQLSTREHSWKSSIILFIPLLIGVIFVQQHLSINRGWNHFIDDVSVAVQIKEVPNWQDVKKYGYPRTNSGESVYPNNYERAAWATAGIETIAANPLGYGLLEHSLGKLIRKSYPEAVIQSAHSAWIDYGLAFGLPGLIFTIGALLSIIVIAINSQSPQRLTAIWIAGGILLIFTFAEVSSKHTIEILFFCIALLNTMVLKKKN
ncbi:O-antigen ligase family protein [Polynucleobacter sp. AP-Kaivos-20-H2]|uniref:O-antigen ligase family protein n=1 Tax=Polynucleobacter sp. AP-Kaivos-20-H2 TaxID=2689104 RepID=UPI001C0C101C|nr:O-antigen ligase family protein [Polynucleobacter sp. AP-Kaivos-20-H2]MBU3604204.1 O-antigen ligase family protein [Polynucleobacter sp. AP-Kaivos-20-H2]